MEKEEEENFAGSDTKRRVDDEEIVSLEDPKMFTKLKSKSQPLEPLDGLFFTIADDRAHMELTGLDLSSAPRSSLRTILLQQPVFF